MEPPSPFLRQVSHCGRELSHLDFFSLQVSQLLQEVSQETLQLGVGDRGGVSGAYAFESILDRLLTGWRTSSADASIDS